MVFKVAIVLCALAVSAYAGGYGHGGGHGGGHSTSSRKQDDHGNFAFNYQITDGKGASNGRWEAGNGYGGVVGSYNIKDIDGRSRRVDYVADKGGFRAKINTNEPGTAHSLPAAAVYNSPYAGPVVHGPAGHGGGHGGGYGGHGGGYGGHGHGY